MSDATKCHVQLFYATTQICSCMCRMQLNFSCKRQLQKPKFLVVDIRSIELEVGAKPWITIQNESTKVVVEQPIPQDVL